MTARNFTVTKVERILLDVPFHPRCARTMDILGSGWSLP